MHQEILPGAALPLPCSLRPQTQFIPFASPVGFMLPTPSFSPVIVLMGSERDRRGTLPLVLLKVARPSAARHKLFTFSAIHTMLPFIPDPF